MKKQINPSWRKKKNKKLCKICGKRERVTLSFCQECREKHNRSTRKLKQLNKMENKCVDCGRNIDSNITRCDSCKLTHYNSNINYRKNKNSKSGYYGQIKVISEVL